MAHLWRRESDDDQWSVLQLDGEEGLMAGVVLLPTNGERGSGWALLANTNAGVAINGLALNTGIRVLSDRDEICIGGRENFFFSTEVLAAIEPFADVGRRLFCPRCKEELAPGDASVKCPQCRLIHHQSEERPCWTYTETCAACAQQSDLQSGYRWSPAEM